MNLFNFGFSTDKVNKQSNNKRKGNQESKEKYEKEKRKRQFCVKWKEVFLRLELYDEEKRHYVL